MNAASLRDDLLYGFHILDQEGQNSGIAGHLTARAPEPDTLLAHGYGQGFEEVRAESMRHADFDLNTLNGGRVNPSLAFHVAIYRSRPDVNAVLHTHAAGAIALSAAGGRFVPVYQSALMLYDDVVYYDRYDGIIESSKVGARMADALGNRSLLHLKNHGIVVAAASIREAVIAALIFEENCAIQLRAMGSETLETFTGAEVARARDFLNSQQVIDLRWAYLSRRAAASRPFLPPPPAFA